jgi:hypothetical protein
MMYSIGLDEFIYTFKVKQNLLKQYCLHFKVGSVGAEIYLAEFQNLTIL